MKRYLTLFTQHLSYYSAYRVNLLFRLFQGFLTPTLLLVVLSRSISHHETLVSLIPYYFFTSSIIPLVSSQVEVEIEQLTTSGEINNFLTKPISLYLYLVTREIGSKLIHLLIIIPFVLIIIYLFPKIFILSLSVKSLILAVSITPLTFYLSYNFAYLVGLLCFWVDEFWAIHNFKFVIYVLLGGAVIPYSFFPPSTQRLLQLSPFAYMLNWPIRVLSDGINYIQLGTAFLWLFAFYGAILLLQRQAILHYSHTAN